MVKNSSLEKKKISTFVKRLRIEYLMINADLTCYEPYVAFVPLPNIEINFEKFSQLIGDKSSQKINRKLSKSDINFGAKMFFTLNSCPSIYVKLYWKAIYGSESKLAKFTSNIIWKAKDGFKVRAQKIFAKISSMIGFKYISYHEGNKSIGINIDLRKNIKDIKGDIQ